MDIEVIRSKLASLQRCIDRIRTVCPQTLRELQEDVDAQDILTLNLSRAVQLSVDISSHILSSTQLPAPQTMGESFAAMETLGVIDADLATDLKKSVGFRNIAVHNYEAINWAVVYSIVTERLGDFTAFAKAIDQWIANNRT